MLSNPPRLLSIAAASLNPRQDLANRHRIDGVEADDDFAEGLVAYFDGFEADDLCDDAGNHLALDEDGQTALLFETRFD